MKDPKPVRIRITAQPPSILQCLSREYHRRAREAVELHYAAPVLFRALVALLTMPERDDKDPAAVVRRALCRNFASHALMLAAGANSMEELSTILARRGADVAYNYDLRPGGKPKATIIFGFGTEAASE